MNVQGWECPRCNKIHSPLISSCDCKVVNWNYIKDQYHNKPCLWDGVSETLPGSGVKIAGLVCSCPKCSVRNKI